MARFLPLRLPEPKLDSCNITLSAGRDGAHPFMFSFENYMAAERFAPYKSARPTAAQQRELYLWNSQLSQEMNKAIGHAEIFIREAIDQQLRAWNLKQPQCPGSTNPFMTVGRHRRVSLANLIRYQEKLGRDCRNSLKSQPHQAANNNYLNY